MEGGFVMALFLGIAFLAGIIYFNKTGEVQGDFIYLSGKRAKDPFMFWVVNIFGGIISIVLLIVGVFGLLFF